MDTAITVLDEMMIRLKESIEFKCIFELGPNRQPNYEFQCMACGVVVTASANSRIEAEQNAARLMLLKLAHRGYFVPSPFGLPPNFSTKRDVASEIPIKPPVDTIFDRFKFRNFCQMDPEHNFQQTEEIDEEACTAAERVLDTDISLEEAEDVLFEVALILGARVELDELQTPEAILCRVELKCMSPLLDFADLDEDRATASQEALRYIRITLLNYHHKI